MRVATNSLYNLSISRINQVKSEMLDANTAVTTGKKINNLSDDPVAVSSILNIKSSITGLDQYTQNVANGREWLKADETALSSVKSLITDAKTTAISMQNGVRSPQDLNSGASSIQGILDQILGLANSQIKGQYIFSGTKTDMKSFVADNSDNPTQINYQGGGTPFGIKMSEASNIDVGYCGNNVFDNSSIVVDDTNNKIDFREDPTGGTVQYGEEMTAVIPNGKYTPEELAKTIGTVMTTRSASTGQPEIRNVSQANAAFVVGNHSALSVPTAGTPISLTYSAATNSWAVANDPGYTPAISIQTLTSNSGHVDLDFNGDHTTDASVNFNAPVPDGYTVSFDISSAAVGGNGVNYSVDYNEGTKKFSIKENGGPVLDNLQLMWATGVNKDTSIAPDIGFNGKTDVTGPANGVSHLSDHDVQWGIFNTLIDLRDYMKNNDTAGINRSISRLSADFDYIGETVSDIGIKQNRLDVRDSIISELNISYQNTRSTLEDADMVSEITKLDQKQFSYNAALSSTAKIIKMSLLDYL